MKQTIYISLIIIVISAFIFILKTHNNYILKSKTVNKKELISFASYYYSAYEFYGNPPLLSQVEHFIEEIVKDSSLTMTLKELNTLLIIDSINNKVKFYDIGFDKVNNYFFSIYDPDTISYIEHFFIKGDILIADFPFKKPNDVIFEKTFYKNNNKLDIHDSLRSILDIIINKSIEDFQKNKFGYHFSYEKIIPNVDSYNNLIFCIYKYKNDYKLELIGDEDVNKEITPFLNCESLISEVSYVIKNKNIDKVLIPARFPYKSSHFVYF